MKTKRTGKILSLILAVCMMFTMMPVAAFAETDDVDSGAPLGTSGTITAFAPLDESVAQRTEEVGTAEEELKLPNELMVTVATEITATGSDAQKETKTTVKVSSWTADTAYDGDSEGVYTFTPTLDLPEGLTLAEDVTLPTITVTVEQAEAVRGAASTFGSGADITIDETNFPDANFRAWLQRQDSGTDGNLTAEEIAGIGLMDVSNKSISDLTGIEYFTALTELSCYTNQLTTLDVSNNTALTILKCGGNKLTALDVSNNIALTGLSCSGNKLTALDVSNNIALTELSCESNRLTSLDVSKNTVMKYLYCNDNLLTTLDVTNNTVLEVLYCFGNYMPGESAIIGLNKGLGEYFQFDPQKSGAPPVDAVTPSITGQPIGATYTQNVPATPLSVTASVTDGGTLSYQWYKNADNSTSGGTAVGTSSPSYTPPTDTVGTTYYYCVVTNTNSGVSGWETATAISNTAVVTVTASSLTGLPVPSIPKWEWQSDGSLKLSWNPVANASSYQVKIYKDEAAPLVVEPINDTELFIDPPIGVGSYTFTVAAVGDGTVYTNSPHSPKSEVLVVTSTGTPAITGVTAPMAMTYAANYLLNFTITFSEPVSVVGTPHIALTIGTTTKYAVYTGNTDGNRLNFRYVVQATDVDLDGIVLSPLLDLNGGTIKNAGGTDAVLTFTPPSTSGILVDGVSPVIYTIRGTIKGSDTNTGIEGADVVIKIGGIAYWQTVTDSAGEYSTVPLTAGTYSMEVSAPAYDTATISGIVISGADAIKDLTLTRTGGTTTYAVNVNGSYASPTGAGSYAKDTTVNIHAGNRSNYTFTGWTSSDVTITGPSSKNASFVMPGKAVTVTANWSFNGGGSDNNGDSGGGSSSGGGSTPPAITTTPPATTPGQPVAATTPVTATAGANGTARASIPDKAITDAIAKAQADAKAQGQTGNGIAVVLDITMPQGATSLSAVLSPNALQSLVSAGVTSLTINGSPVKVTFDLKALQEIQKQSNGTIKISIAPQANLSAAAKAMIGTRPVYNITVGYGSGKTVSGFGGGTATVSVPYTPAKGEVAGALYAVYVDEKGNATRIAGSAYDANSRSILFTTTHFSLYGVGYTAPSAKFTDIGTHWAKESIDYVVGRGLLSGTSETTFAPNTTMTRGMLVTALGRLAGVEVKAYTENSFTDVKVDSPFRPYIEWAYSKGIVKGIGNQQFAPDRAVTREEMAVIFTNYAKTTGYKLPVTRDAAAFADASGIGSAYKTAVTAMQQAGIMMGEQNNKFNPKANATRAEVSSMLNRYIKLTIDPATAQGWALNDDGQYMYHKDGKALTGTQTIEGVKYFFNTDGTLKNGWVKDGGNWRYYSGNKSAAGWLDISDKRYYFTKDGLMVSDK